MNNETAEKRDPNTGLPINSGPPDQSLSRVLPGNGVFGFETLYGSNNFPGDTHERAHLVLDIDGAPQQPQFGAIPFIGLFYSSQGTFSANATPAHLFTGITSYPTILRWSQRLWQVQYPQSIDTLLTAPAASTQPGTLAAYVQVFAKWGTHPKFIQIHTFHYWEQGNNKNGAPFDTDAVTQAGGILYEGGWNWPYSQSFFYPGGELVDIKLSALKTLCNISLPDMSVHPNVDLTYTLDLQALFNCPAIKRLWKEPMPTGVSIPVVSIGWPEEGTGVGGGIWTDVHSMGIYTSSTLPVSTASPQEALNVVSSNDGPDVAQIRSRLRTWGEQTQQKSPEPVSQ